MYSDSSPFISHKTYSTTVYLIATRLVKYLFVAVGRWSFKKQRNSRHMILSISCQKAQTK